jgi:hypothetical protein
MEQPFVASHASRRFPRDGPEAPAQRCFAEPAVSVPASSSVSRTTLKGHVDIAHDAGDPARAPQCVGGELHRRLARGAESSRRRRFPADEPATTTVAIRTV